MELFMQMFPGIGTFFAVEPAIAIARIVLIVFGFILAVLCFKRTLEPLIMVPMGLGMIAVNCGTMFLTSGTVGNLLLDPLVSDAAAIVDTMQINFLQPTVPSADFTAVLENAVRSAQQYFGLPQTGIVDYPTWYKVSEIYVAVSRIAELNP